MAYTEFDPAPPVFTTVPLDSMPFFPIGTATTALSASLVRKYMALPTVGYCGGVQLVPLCC
jgi:hypothetical protein